MKYRGRMVGQAARIDVHYCMRICFLDSTAHKSSHGTKMHVFRSYTRRRHCTNQRFWRLQGPASAACATSNPWNGVSIIP